MVELLPNLPKGCEFHHIGYATASLEKDRDFFSLLGYRQEGALFVDPLQGVFGCFMLGPGPRLELLQNTRDSNTLTPWLASGIKMYHLAYLVDDLEVAVNWSRSQRGKVVIAPTPAVAFDGRCISFVIFRNGLMLELIQKLSQSENIEKIK